jgi:hypothetical protein
MANGSKLLLQERQKTTTLPFTNIHQPSKFLVQMSNGAITCNELSNIIKDQHNKELHKPDSAAWSLKAISNHQGPLNSSDKGHTNSSCNVLVHWEDGSETFKLLTVMAEADLLTCTLPCAKTSTLQDGNH